ncbi:MAG: cytochrome P450 [Dehalococcoidia bacterium]|nr:cytochrome P450 [Dehalococcoidia bacterium]
MGFNPFDPAFREDPYPTYTALLQGEPVREGILGLFVLPRYADCVAMLRDPRSSNDQRNSEMFDAVAAAQSLDADTALMESQPFLFMDPPDHTRLRGLVSKAFTPRVIDALRPRIQAIVDDLVGAALARGSMDVIEDLAYPLPVRVISEMLGVPPEDHERFKAWSRVLAKSLDFEIVVPPEVLQQRLDAGEAFRAYFAELIAERRTAPRDDLLSALIAAEEAGDTLSEAELLTTCVLLLVAGHETTVNLIGNGVLQLLRHPAELQRLRDDPSLIRSAVEEVLRYDPPVRFTARIALDDIPIPGGVVPKGKQAILLLGAANRDPAQFADPGRFDIGRQDNRHIAFGMGIHFCLGAPLARVEGQIAIGTLVARVREIALAGAPVYREQITLRGLERLPVTLSGS